MISVRVPGVALLFVACALGVGACGDSDDDGSAGAATTQAADSTSPVSDKSQIRKEMLALQDAFYAGKGKEWCARVTEQAASGTAKAASVDKNLTCVGAIKQSVPVPVAPRFVKQYRAKILSIKVSGDKATLTVSQSKQPPRRLSFVKQDGTWKFNSSLNLAPTG